MGSRNKRDRKRKLEDSESESSESSDSSPRRSSRSSGRSRRSRGRKRSPSVSESDSDSDHRHKKKKSSRKISDNDIAEYMAKKAQRKAMKVAKKLKGQTVSGYSNDSNPFGDSNLNEKFVWRKKIEKDVYQGVPLDEFSVKAEKKRQKERMAEIEKVKKRREERALEKAQHEEEMALLARERARAEFQDLEKKEDEKKRTAVLEEQQRRIQLSIASKPPPPPPSDNFELKAIKAMGAMEEGDAIFGSNAEISLDSAVYWWHDKYRPRKPKYFNRVHTGYEWNKYNQTHYDHDNPPPKIVQGYKFNIFYPDLVDKTKAPTYTIDKDGNSDETCIIRFHAGPPYEDIAFRIVNKEWEYSHKKGFKCTFERGILHVYFNFKRHRYRR
ncbi:CTN [Linum perenne]